MCLSGGQQESEHIYKRRVEKNNEKNIEGKWTEEENLKYVVFMDYHSKVFMYKEKRKYHFTYLGLNAFSSL